MPMSSSLPKKGETYVAPARAARRACVELKISVTFVLMPSEARTLVAFKPSPLTRLYWQLEQVLPTFPHSLAVWMIFPSLVLI